jgi:soluble lytic murein transglycosylase-like protein
VIRETRYHIGMGAPYHYFMGQIEQESNCREGATAFDGGMGLGQFMPATADWIHQQEPTLKKIWKKPMPYDPKWNIRAMILYDKRLYETGKCEGWYFAFRSYNGGQGNLNKEIRRAGSCEITLVEKQCARKKIKLKCGSVLDLCKVNIEYPYLIFEKGEKYK